MAKLATNPRVGGLLLGVTEAMSRFDEYKLECYVTTQVEQVGHRGTCDKASKLKQGWT
jgi:hypothetical protein